jgi:hypothetical protein
VVSTELDKTDGVDVEDVPSAAWGWSKENHKVIQIGGILSALFLLAMLRGNHVGRVEDIFLITFAALLVIAVARDWWLRRRGWTR